MNDKAKFDVGTKSPKTASFLWINEILLSFWFILNIHLFICIFLIVFKHVRSQKQKYAEYVSPDSTPLNSMELQNKIKNDNKL